MSDLLLADVASLDDLRTYAARARRLDPEAAVRLLAAGPVLAAYVGVLPGRGVTGSGATLGLRVFGLAEPAEVDVTVPAAAVLDRLAREPVLDRVAREGSDPGEARLPIPPMSVFVPWAGITPPRSGWEPYAAFPGADVIAAAEAGIAEVGVAGTGLAAQVEALRSRVWAQPLGESPAPAGLAFAAYGLGFVHPQESVTLLRAGRWWRLTAPGGHALARS